MKVERPGSHASVKLQRSISPGGIFGELLVLHSRAVPADRAILEPVIFTRVINYKRDLKRNKINLDD